MTAGEVREVYEGMRLELRRLLARLPDRGVEAMRRTLDEHCVLLLYAEDEAVAAARDAAAEPMPMQQVGA